MSARLTGKVAIVAGAGQTPGSTTGNGRACALRFAAEGARVVCADLHEDSAAETVAMIEAAGGEGIAVGVDVTNEDACATLIEQTIAVYDQIDILHNNVGIGTHDTTATHMSEEIWDGIMGTNLKSAVFATKHVLPVMRKQEFGSIIYISSIAAVCSIGMAAYKASKAALNAYSHSVALGNAKYGIRVNVIMPGLMNTPMAIEGFASQGRDRETLIRVRNESVPLKGGMGSAADVANAALFLASDEASFITGICLAVDGGQMARIG